MSNHTLGKNESHRVEFKCELTTDQLYWQNKSAPTRFEF